MPAPPRAHRCLPGDCTDTAAVTQLYLMYVILPLWLLVGIADWLCHRASRIETTSGAKESLIHLLMLVEVGIPVLMGLFLEINGLVILLMIAGWILHEITAHWDLKQPPLPPSMCGCCWRRSPSWRFCLISRSSIVGYGLGAPRISSLPLWEGARGRGLRAIARVKNRPSR